MNRVAERIGPGVLTPAVDGERALQINRTEPSARAVQCHHLQLIAIALTGRRGRVCCAYSPVPFTSTSPDRGGLTLSPLER